jgi:hypothetical protein
MGYRYRLNFATVAAVLIALKVLTPGYASETPLPFRQYEQNMNEGNDCFCMGDIDPLFERAVITANCLQQLPINVD